LSLFGGEALKRLFLICVPCDVHELEVDGPRLAYDLCRMAVDFEEGSAQRLVSPDHLVQAVLKRSAVERSRNTHSGGGVVERIAGHEAVEKP
jgi:hypothetical protein